MNEIENLPNTWAKAQVRELIDLINGFAFKPSHWKSHGLPIIRIQNLNNPEAAFNYCPEDLPRKYLVDSGDLLFAWSGTPGTSFGAHIWQGGKAWLNQHIFKIQLNEGYLNKKFLRLAINQNLNQYIRAAHGAAGLAHITKGKFESSELMIPPLREQKRIIDEIEKQFTRLDAAVAALRRIQANLKRYRASVLKAACEGRLVPTEAELARREGRDYEPADQLLARILKERRVKWEADQFAKMQTAGKPPKDDKWKAKYQKPAPPDTTNLPDLPEGWTWATIGHLSSAVQYGTSAKTNEDLTGIPVIRMGNIVGGRISLSLLRFLPHGHKEFPELLLRPGDILFNRTNSAELVGKTAVYRGNPSPCSFASYLIRVRLAGEYEPDLIAYFLNSVLGRAWIASVVSQQVGQANVNGSKLQALAVPTPPSAEQHRIVAEVDRRLSVIDELASIVHANMKRAERLRQAILKRAFEGKLVPQDPNDEPAGALLDRICAERAKAQQTRASRGERSRRTTSRRQRTKAEL